MERLQRARVEKEEEDRRGNRDVVRAEKQTRAEEEYMLGMDAAQRTTGEADRGCGVVPMSLGY